MPEDLTTNTDDFDVRTFVQENVNHTVQELLDGVELPEETFNGLISRVSSIAEEAQRKKNFGLLKTRDELLAEKKSEKQRRQELEAKLAPYETSGVTIEAFNEYKSKYETLLSTKDDAEKDINSKLTSQFEAGKKNGMEYYKPQLESLNSKLKDYEQRNNYLKEKYINSETDKAFNDILDKIGFIREPKNDPVIWGLKSKLEKNWDEEEGTFSLTIDRAPAEDWVEHWATTEAGKPYVRALYGSGVGEMSSSNKLNNTNKRRKEIEDLMNTPNRTPEQDGRLFMLQQMGS